MAGDVTKYLKLVTSEHSDKPNYMAMIAAVCQPYADIVDLCNSVSTLYDIDQAVGVQLDVIGQWVGVNRQLIVPLVGVYFQLDTVGVGLDSGILQGPFDPSTGLTSLPDNYYRLLLKAKILNNHWDGSKATAYTLGNLLFSAYGYQIFIQDNTNLTIDIGLLGPGTPPIMVIAMLTTGMLNLKPATIHVSSYIYPAAVGPLFALDLNNLNFAGLDTGYLANVVLN